MENAVDDGRNRHGFPRGYHFVPHDLELMQLLDEQRAGRPLPYPLSNVFHHVRIRDFHPARLYEVYKEHEEAGYIYFFDHREYRAGRGPARATKDGGWKASGGGKAVRRGGMVVGYKLTMVFYQKEEHPGKPDRNTDWALNEYTTIVGPNNKVADLALYRLYNKRTVRGAVPAPVVVKAPPFPIAGGTSKANQASVAVAASTSPKASTGQPHHHDHQFAHGAAAAWAPGPSTWVTPAAVNPHAGGCMGQTGSPRSPAAEGYLADEFKVWCETKQEDPQAASPCWFPMPYDDLLPDLPMLMDESELYSCTLEQLLAPMQDHAAAPATSTPEEGKHQV